MKIHNLTGLRFIVAYIVLISHVLGAQYFALNEMGGISVQIFFVLSGFVLYINYCDKITQSSISWKRFLYLRLARIYPMYFLSITLFLIFTTHKTLSLIKIYLMNICMFQSWSMKITTVFNQFNAPSWSVSDEMFFYIMFFMMISNCITKSRLLIFSVIYYIAWTFILLIIHKANVANDMIKWFWYANPSYRLCDFLFGCIAGYAYQTVLKNSQKPIFSYFLGLQQYTMAVSLIQISLLITIFSSHIIWPIDIKWYSINTLLVCNAFLIILFYGLFPIGFFAKILSHRLMVFLGESSYSLYLIHFFVLFIIIPRYFQPYIENTQILLFIKLGLPVIFATILYKYFEQPIYKKLRKY